MANTSELKIDPLIENIVYLAHPRFVGVRRKSGTLTNEINHQKELVCGKRNSNNVTRDKEPTKNKLLKITGILHQQHKIVQFQIDQFDDVLEIIQNCDFEYFSHLLVIVMEINEKPLYSLDEICGLINNNKEKFKKFSDLVIELKFNGEKSENCSDNVRDKDLMVFYVKNNAKLFTCVNTKIEELIENEIKIAVGIEKLVENESPMLSKKECSSMEILKMLDDTGANSDGEEKLQSDNSHFAIFNLLDDESEEKKLANNQKTPDGSKLDTNFLLKALLESGISFLDLDLSPLTHHDSVQPHNTILELLKSAIRAKSHFNMELMSLFELNLNSLEVFELLSMAVLTNSAIICKILLELHTMTENALNDATEQEVRNHHDIANLLKGTFPFLNEPQIAVKIIDLIQNLTDEGEIEQLLRALVKENGFKFCKIIFYFIKSIKFERWHDLISEAISLEYFDVVGEFLSLKLTTDDALESCKSLIKNHQDIFDEVKHFHDNIKFKNLHKCKKFIKAQSKMKHVILNEKSALRHSLECKHFEIYAFLKINGFVEDKIDQIMTCLGIREKKKIRDAMYKATYICKDAYISAILLKFKYTSAYINADDTSDMLHKLKIHNELNPLLKIVSGSKVEVYFNYLNKGVKGIDPQHDEETIGMIYYKAHKIIIGKDSSPEARFGTFAHEITHYVMYVMFDNGCLPYCKEDKKQMEKYEQVFLATKKRYEENKDKMDEVIRWCFGAYEEKVQRVELIVRVPHLVGKYHDNEEKIQEQRELLPELFDFYEEDLIPIMMAEKIIELTTFNKESTIMKNAENSLVSLRSENLKEIVTEKKRIIVKTNSPMLTLQNIYQEISEKESSYHQIFINNLMVDLDIFNKKSDKDELKKIVLELFDSKNIQRVIVNASTKPDFLTSPTAKEQRQVLFKEFREDVQYLIVVADDQSVVKIDNFDEIEIRHNWNDLTEIIQENLLNTKLYFQGRRRVPLKILISSEDAQHAFNHEVINELLNIKSYQKLKEAYSYDNSDTKLKEKITNELLQNKIFKELSVKFKARNENAEIMKKSIECLDTIDNARDEVEQEVSIILSKYSSSEINYIPNQSVENYIERPLQMREKLVDNFQLFDESDPNRRDYMTQKMKTTEISPDSLEDKKFVVICDVDCSGKTSFLKNIHDTQKSKHKNRWLSFISIKSHIDEFSAEGINSVDFADFFIDKILKLKNPLEIAIFKNLYKQQKVVIFFDDIDVLSPEALQNFINFIRFFESLQIWLSVNFQCKEKVESELIVTAYNLKPITQSEQLQVAQNLRTSFESINDEREYYKNAEKILKKIPKQGASAIGMFLPIKIMAEVFIHQQSSFEKCSSFFNMFKVYFESMIKENVEEDKREAVHTSLKIEALQKFKKSSEDVEEIFMSPVDHSIMITDISLPGITKIEGTNFYFSNDIFADFIVSYHVGIVLKMKLAKESKFFDFFIELLNRQEYNVVRVFLNDYVGDAQNIITEKWALNLADGLEYVTKNLPKSLKFLQNASNEGQFELCACLLRILKYFSCSLKLVIDFKGEGGKSFLMNLIKSVTSVNEQIFIEIFESTLALVESENYSSTIYEFLTHNDDSDKTILHHLSIDEVPVVTFTRVWRIFEKILSEDELKTFLMINNFELRSFVHTGILYYEKNIEKLKVMLEIVISKLNLKEKYDFASSKDRVGFNLLQLSTFTDDLVFDLIFTFINDHFTDLQVFKLIFEHNHYKNNVLHTASISSSVKIVEKLWLKVEEILNFEWLYSKRNFESIRSFAKSQNILLPEQKFIEENELLKSFLSINGNEGQTPLQLSLKNSKHPKVFQFLFEISFSLCMNKQEIRELMKQKNANNDNLLSYAANFGSPENANFIIQEIHNNFEKSEIIMLFKSHEVIDGFMLHAALLKNSIDVVKAFFDFFMKFNTKEEMKTFMMKKHPSGENLLHFAVRYQPMKSLHEILDIIAIIYEEKNNSLISEDINSFENLLKSKGSIQNNLLQTAIRNPNEDAFEWTWNLLNDYQVEKIEDLFHYTNKDGDNLIKYCFAYGSLHNIKFLWSKVKIIFDDEQVVELLCSKGYMGRNLLADVTIKNQDPDVVRFLWRILKDTIKDENKLREILHEKDSKGDLLLHIVSWEGSLWALKFTWDEIEKIIHEEEARRDYLLLKGQFERIALTASALNKNELVFAWMLRKFLNFFEIKEKVAPDVPRQKINFFEILTTIDGMGTTLISVIFTMGTVNKITLILKTISKYNFKTQQEILLFKGIHGRNLLTLATINNKNLEVVKKCWNLFAEICEIFPVIDDEELEFLQHLDLKFSGIDEHKKTLFRSNSSLVLNFDNRACLHCSPKPQKKSFNAKNVEKDTKKAFKRSLKEEFLHKMITEEDEFKLNLLHLTIAYCPCDVFEFVWEEFLKVEKNPSKVKEFLTTKGKGEKNLLILALGNNSWVFESVLDIFIKYLTKSDTKKKIIESDKLKKDNCNILDIMRNNPKKFEKQHKILCEKMSEIFSEEEKNAILSISCENN